MNYQNDDLRIKEINELLPPVALLEKFPATENAANTVAHARKAIHKILKGNDDRLLVVIDPVQFMIRQRRKSMPPVCWRYVMSFKASLKLSCASILRNRVPPSAGKG